MFIVGVAVGVVAAIGVGYFVNKGFRAAVQTELKTIQAEVTAFESTGKADFTKVKTAVAAILAKL